MTDPTPDPGPRRMRAPRALQALKGRGRAALLVPVLAAGGATPITSALAAGGHASAQLAVGLRTGGARALVSRLTLAQLAALLGTSPAGLIARVEALLSGTPFAPLVSGLPASPSTTVQELIDRLRGNGLDPAALPHLLEALLGPLQGSSEELRAAIVQILEDLEGDGQLELVAGELGVPPSELKASLQPVTDEALAATVNTTVDHLAGLLREAGAGPSSIGASHSLVYAPVASPGEGSVTELVAFPGSGGPALTTIRSSPGGTTVLGYTSSFVDNAFAIISVKLNRAGQIVETVRVPAAGRLAISANGKSTAARRGRRARHLGVRVKPFKGAIAAGTHSFVLRPRPGLAHAARTTVSLVTSYKPTGGTANTKHKTVIFRHATRKGAKQR